MRRLDHSMIFVFIAGSFTPIVVLASIGQVGATVLVLVWAGAIAGVGVPLFWLHAPRWVTSLCYLIVGWMAAITMPWLWQSLGVWRFALFLGGGLLFTVGAVVYARKRPDPAPLVFGYHEVFHALVIVAVACHLVLVSSLLG